MYFKDLLRDVEVQKTALTALENNLTSMSGVLRESLLERLGENLLQIGERFQFVHLYFKPCSGDGEYSCILGEYAESLLEATGKVIAQCSSLVDKKRDIRLSEELFQEDIKATEVRDYVVFDLSTRMVIS